MLDWHTGSIRRVGADGGRTFLRHHLTALKLRISFRQSDETAGIDHAWF